MVNQVNLSGSQPLLAVAPAPRPTPTRSATPAAPAKAPAGSEATAVAQVNQHLEQAQTDLKLQFDPGSGRTVIQVVQQGTGELVMQIPSEEVLGMSRRLRQAEGQGSLSGALLDQQG